MYLVSDGGPPSAVLEAWPADSPNPDQASKLGTLSQIDICAAQMSLKPCCSHQNPGVANAGHGRQCRVSEVLEIATSALCNVVMWEYTVQNEAPRRPAGVSSSRSKLGMHDQLTDW
jgi:hypothetical protein